MSLEYQQHANVDPGTVTPSAGEPTALWLEAHAACDGNRDRMWEWLEARLEAVKRERNEYLQQRDFDYARFQSTKQALLQEAKEKIAAEARVRELEGAALAYLKARAMVRVHRAGMVGRTDRALARERLEALLASTDSEGTK